MEKIKIFNKIKISTAISLVIVGFVAAMIFNMQVIEPVTQQEYKSKTHHLSWLGDPSGDASGFCAYYHYPHSADPTSDYATNLSTGTAYEYITALSGEMTGETPHSTTFDYVLKLVVNDTIGYNSSSSSWEPSWVYMNMSVDYSFGSDIAWSNMTLVEITNNTNFCWYNAYLNNGGSGYTLYQNQRTNSSLNCTVYSG